VAAAPNLQSVVNDVAETVASSVNTVVQPDAAASVAESFSFPLALMVIVVLFLLAQPRVDRKDPRLLAVAQANDPEIQFEGEDDRG
jgi:hypothetical protein